MIASVKERVRAQINLSGDPIPGSQSAYRAAAVLRGVARNDQIDPAYANLKSEEIRAAVSATRKRGFSLNAGCLKDDVRAVGFAVGRINEPPLAAVRIATSQARIGTRKRKEFESLLYNELRTRDWTFP